MTKLRTAAVTSMEVGGAAGSGGDDKVPAAALAEAAEDDADISRDAKSPGRGGGLGACVTAAGTAPPPVTAVEAVLEVVLTDARLLFDEFFVRGGRGAVAAVE